jgi:uncharacterized caspase-like protein
VTTESTIMPRIFSPRVLTTIAVLVGLLTTGLVSSELVRAARPEAGRSHLIAFDRSKPPAAVGADRIALVIGNAIYPDADAPLPDVASDSNALAYTLRKHGFLVDTVHDGTRSGMRDAVERLKARVHPGAVVLVYFGGFAVQSRGDNYMLPVDAKIWTEADIRHDGVSLERLLSDLAASGARTRLAVIDASRRNPYERRFRSYSHGLAPIEPAEAGTNALIITSTSPGQVIEEPDGPRSPFVTALVSNMDSRTASAQEIFEATRAAVASETGNRQVPAIRSSLTQDVSLGSAFS